MITIVLGFLLFFLAVAIFSLKSKMLDPSGALASFVVGTMILLLGGWKIVTIVLAFFFLGIFATMVKREYKREKSIVAWETIRNWRNVVANSAVAIFFLFAESLVSSKMMLAGFLGAISASTADTFATEIGLLYPGNPRLIINLKKKVPAGISGAISPLGEIAMIAGLITMGFIVWIVGVRVWNFEYLLLIILLSGIISCTFDSLLGCTVQAIYKCGSCGKLTEKWRHCDVNATYLKGKRLIDNDVVNFLSTMIGSVVAIITTILLTS